MLMSYHEEIVGPISPSGIRLAVNLVFDDLLNQHKPGTQSDTQSDHRKWVIQTLSSNVTNQQRADSTGLENSISL